MRSLAATFLLALAVTSCVPPGSPGVEAGSGPGSDLVPTFAPASPAAPDATSGTAGAEQEEVPTTAPHDGDDPSGDPSRQEAPGTSTERTPSQPAAETTAPAPILRAAVDDGVGDVTTSVEPPPDHADLVRTEVIRDAVGFMVLHQLRGDAPPDTDDEHTMNIATFFDVDGDGEVDHHVWANLSSSGWGSAYFDERSGKARYADEDDVDVHVDDEGRVVVRFPHGHLSDARSFRWSVGSEWGRYEVIGTDAAARDSAPEDHGSVSFPR